MGYENMGGGGGDYNKKGQMMKIHATAIRSKHVLPQLWSGK